MLHTKTLIIHVSTVCSDSGSNESRPIVILCSSKGEEEEKVLRLLSFKTHVSRKSCMYVMGRV